MAIEGSIDFESPIEYDQLYAQLKQEVEEEGLRYYLTKEEEQALMQHNLNYQKMNGLGEMLLSQFERPAEGEDGEWLSVKEISSCLKQAFRGAFKNNQASYIKIGNFLSRPEYKFERRRKTSGWEYWVKRR